MAKQFWLNPYKERVYGQKKKNCERNSLKKTVNSDSYSKHSYVQKISWKLEDHKNKLQLSKQTKQSK